MFRLWGKLMCNNHMIKDMTVCEESEDTRTHKIFRALEDICYAWDLGKPIWLDATIQEFQRHKKARFYHGFPLTTQNRCDSVLLCCYYPFGFHRVPVT